MAAARHYCLSRLPVQLSNGLFVFLPAHSPSLRLAFYGLGSVVVINLLLWVRNGYGIVWLFSIGLILGGIYYLQDPQLMRYSMMFVGALLLVESLFSAFIIFVLSIKYPNDAGDATSLKQLTHLSARFWGFYFSHRPFMWLI